MKTSRYTSLGLYAALLFFSVLLLRITLQYTPLRDDVAFLRIKQQYLHISVWHTAFFVHVFMSMGVLVAGFTQFSSFILQKYPRVHRAMGYAYIVNILFITGPAAFIMACYANGGNYSRLAFGLLAVLWWSFTFWAIRAVWQRNFAAHRAYMVRSYALTLSAVTLRAWKYVLVWAFHPPPMTVYRLVAWLGFVPNLLVAEWLIRRVLRKKAVREGDLLPKKTPYLATLLPLPYLSALLAIGVASLSAMPSYAQPIVPGYQGKRLFGEFSIAAIPTIIGPSVANLGIRRFGITPNGYDISTRFCGSLTYIIGRRKAIFVGYQYCRTGMLMQAVSPSLQSSQLTGFIDPDRHDLFMQLRTHIGEVGYEQSIAPALLSPLGAYLRFTLQGYQIYSDILDKSVTFSPTYGGTQLRATGIVRPSTWDISAGWEIGSRTVIANRFTLNIGVRNNWSVLGLATMRLADDSGESSEIDVGSNYKTYNYHTFEREARSRMLSHSLIMVYAGIGILIF